MTETHGPGTMRETLEDGRRPEGLGGALDTLGARLLLEHELKHH